MSEQIHIYIYYNLLHEEHISSNNDYEIKSFNTREISIITDEKIVREILSNPSNKLNKFGELIDYDLEQFKKIINHDISLYKSSDFKINYKFNSIYYIKCELAKDISFNIYNFMNDK